MKIIGFSFIYFKYLKEYWRNTLIINKYKTSFDLLQKYASKFRD